MGDQMMRAWQDWLAAEATAQPVVIVLEDLQWGDPPTVSFTDAALRHLKDRPLMVLALARPEVHEVFPKLWAERGTQEIRLGELTRRASEKLVREVLGESVTAVTVDRIVQLAAGNAFYLEELIRAVAEGREEALPETVLAMVEARLAKQRTGGDVEALLKSRHERIPLGFMGDGRDTANAALFLASDEARFITGTEIVVDGGMTARCD